MNAYQKRKAERAAKVKARRQEKREEQVLLEATAGVPIEALLEIKRQFIEFENIDPCGCKGDCDG